MPPINVPFDTPILMQYNSVSQYWRFTVDEPKKNVSSMYVRGPRGRGIDFNFKDNGGGTLVFRFRCVHLCNSHL